MPGPARVLTIVHEADAPPGRLEPAAQDAGLVLDVRSAAAGDPVPTELDGAAGLVVLGAGFDHDDAAHPHLLACLALFRDALARDVPALGLCLGGQLAARALGGSVSRGDSGLERGWVAIRTTDAGAGDPVAATVGDGRPLFAWHYDMFSEPPGATRILTADRYPAQGFRLGSVWGLQPHPEVDASIISAWCDDDPGAPREELVGPADRLGATGAALLVAWCAVVVERARVNAR